ncbi:Pseudechetoxin [Dactylellina cionopaga]|nr:Pseudechetoxin [Dactylellina cionopaga]
MAAVSAPVLAAPLEMRSLPGGLGTTPGSDQQQQYAPSYPPSSGSNNFEPESSFKDEILKAHNEVRALHGVPPLSWSEDLVNYAQTHTPQCVYGHTPTAQADQMGESILYGQGNPAEMARQMWYDKELPMYNFQSGGFSGSTGHLTAMIWKSTTDIGCMVCKADVGTFLKCNYRPAGNTQGQFQANVFPAGSSNTQVGNQNQYNPTPQDQNNPGTTYPTPQTPGGPGNQAPSNPTQSYPSPQDPQNQDNTQNQGATGPYPMPSDANAGFTPSNGPYQMPGDTNTGSATPYDPNAGNTPYLN